ncbi:EamA family transporter RarD [Pleionea mediterranea]|jgi:chloramphenicol-sensitive protein RarD|uniref:Chloramphenicol-sensitive protein RarD n=1 Tax=Pleionea mediterranea TaxID=523701 RepID=A0A316FWM3_9GAMM|nr:EamA family transporter RarD [Pleionea mediterranea]PWK52978.1 chloramphenicol-sensitive protein RarD [Pleionea mediterranea]
MSAVMTQEKQGYIAAMLAYIWWGLVPIYFKALSHVDAMEILMHRIAWCVPTVLLFMWLLKAPVAIKAIWQNRRLFWALVASTLLVSNNWFIFTWAVVNDRVLDTSLGYFINPLLSILLGVVLLKETMNKLQWTSVAIAAVAVINQIIMVGEVPWLSLALALTFGLYGLVRKQTPVDSLNGLLMETLIAFPFALAVILYFLWQNDAMFLNDTRTTDFTLAAGGIVTAVPLILFAIGARRLPLYAIGFLQFIAPTMTFLLAVVVYKEPFGWQQGITFGLIWLALSVYLTDSMIKRFRRRTGVANL